MTEPIRLDDDTWLVLRRPDHTPGIFAAVERSREHLRRWLDWVDFCTSTEDIDARQAHAKKLRDRGELFEFVVIRQGAVIGKVDVHEISSSQGSARLGYWLSAEVEGHGIVSKAVSHLTRFGFEAIGLDRIEIWTAADNYRSQAVATRAGYLPKASARDESATGGSDEFGAKFVMTRQRWVDRRGRIDVPKSFG